MRGRHRRPSALAAVPARASAALARAMRGRHRRPSAVAAVLARASCHAAAAEGAGRAADDPPPSHLLPRRRPGKWPAICHGRHSQERRRGGATRRSLGARQARAADGASPLIARRFAAPRQIDNLPPSRRFPPRARSTRAAAKAASEVSSRPRPRRVSRTRRTRPRTAAGRDA